MKMKKFEGNVIKRGQRVASYRTLSEESGLTVKATRTALNHLKWDTGSGTGYTPKILRIYVE